MSEINNRPFVSIRKRISLILACPIFSILNENQVNELANLMQEVEFNRDEIIVAEGQLVDSVYIIVHGEAEVNRIEKTKHRLISKKKQTQVPLAKISSGETIGLNDTGFFSTTGKRTATVVAMTKMKLLTLDLLALQFFLNKYNLLPSMNEMTDQLLRILLIKESLPFRKLSHERLQRLSNQVEEIAVKAGEVIFEQGAIGDRCYLISSGKIEIVNQEKGLEQHLAILKKPTLFGEATLMTQAPRNATARALEDSNLLVLKHEYLTELIETEKNVASTFMSLMVDRSRPAQNPHVKDHHFISTDEQEIVILKNPDNGSYFKLSEEGWYVWDHLDGTQTMQDLTLGLADKYNLFIPDVIVGLISKLARGGFLTNINLETKVSTHQPTWAQGLNRIRQLLEARVAFGDADRGLTSIYHKWGYLFFTKLGKFFLLIIAIVGLIAFGFETNNVINLFKTIPNSWMLLVLMIPFTVLSVALHELGHALVAKSYGHEIHYMGVGWYWLSPVAFTDTSDMWLSKKKWPRIMVNLAGVYADIIVGGIASILIFIVPNAYVQGFFWLFALYAYINAFRMLNPFQELDGYYVLMDVLDRPHLRQSSVLWLVKKFPKLFKHPELLAHSKPELGYWISCLIFLILLCLLTLLVQSFVFKIFNITPGNPLVVLILPLLLVIVSSVGVIAEIKSKAGEE